MWQAAGNIWKIPDLRRKLLFTLSMIAAYEIGIFGHNGTNLSTIRNLTGPMEFMPELDVIGLGPEETMVLYNGTLGILDMITTEFDPVLDLRGVREIWTEDIDGDDVPEILVNNGRSIRVYDQDFQLLYWR